MANHGEPGELGAVGLGRAWGEYGVLRTEELSGNSRVSTPGNHLGSLGSPEVREGTATRPPCHLRHLPQARRLHLPKSAVDQDLLASISPWRLSPPRPGPAAAVGKNACLSHPLRGLLVLVLQSRQRSILGLKLILGEGQLLPQAVHRVRNRYLGNVICGKPCWSYWSPSCWHPLRLDSCHGQYCWLWWYLRRYLRGVVLFLACPRSRLSTGNGVCRGKEKETHGRRERMEARSTV